MLFTRALVSVVSGLGLFCATGTFPTKAREASTSHKQLRSQLSCKLLPGAPLRYPEYRQPLPQGHPNPQAPCRLHMAASSFARSCRCACRRLLLKPFFRLTQGYRNWAYCGVQRLTAGGGGFASPIVVGFAFAVPNSRLSRDAAGAIASS